MSRERLQPTKTWAEDRAMQRCDPSADSGAETGVRTGLRCPVPLLCHALRDWHESDQPSRQDAVIFSTRGRHPVANPKPPRFQFTVNQDIAKPPAAGGITGAQATLKAKEVAEKWITGVTPRVGIMEAGSWHGAVQFDGTYYYKYRKTWWHHKDVISN